MADRDVTLTPGLPGTGRWVRVAALGRAAGLAWLRGDAAGCRAALDRQRRLAVGHPPSEVTAFTSSALLTAASGNPGPARRDLAEAGARLHAVGIAALAPQWEQAALVCDWVAGDPGAAQARTARLEAMPPPVPAAVTLGLRAEVLRRTGRTGAARLVADRLSIAAPRALAAWALAGLDTEPAVALTRLRTATEAAWRDGHQGLIPLLLHRMARIAVDAGEPETAAEAHAEFARLEDGGPLTRALAGLTEARATGSIEPARLAHHVAESAGLTALAADALHLRDRLGYASAPPPGGRKERRARDVAPALTPRERELAGLVRTGRTNRQIAEAMHLSVKSVEAYLTRVYAKTGCATRLQLALALSEGRVEADRTS
jgi:DNA-binding CsgD family transcriptional regulator